jgi:uncharacterized DUF497 family protein
MDFAARTGIPNWEFRLIFGRTRIEYDPQKEQENRRKHGISLESAVALLQRLMMSGITGRRLPFATSDSFNEKGEARQMHLCVDDDGKVLMMVTTMREDEIVRPISIRRASDTERTQFRKLTAYVEPREADLNRNAVP